MPRRVATDGMRSSEFWLSALILVAATLLAFFGHLSDTSWMAVAAGVTGAYSVSRGLAKRRSVP